MTTISEWLETRPAAVRAVAEEFPIGTVVRVSGRAHFVIGYTEDSLGRCRRLVVSVLSLDDDYERSRLLSHHIPVRYARLVRRRELP